MSKAVWTMLVLVMASFTGCLGSTDDVEPEGQDDNLSTQQQSGGGDGGDNDTEEDEIFLQALQNLTSRINDLSNTTQDLIDENELLRASIDALTSGNELLRASIDALTSENEELQDTISNLEFYQYDAPASHSNISMIISYSTGGEPRTINFSKMGNTIHMNASWDIPPDHEIWFYDNTGQLISYGRIETSYDRCYANGNWTTSYVECSDHTSTIIYEFNLLREPLCVAYGQSMSITTLECFPSSPE